MAPPPFALPPQTPTRALLNRIRRRSQVVPDAAPPLPLPLSRALRNTATTTSTTSTTADDKHNNDDDDHSALERQVDALLEAGESKDKIIADLKKNNAELRAELKMQKQLAEELKLSNKKRLNDQTLSNLENEFHQQENILQGLQRDNEEKTIEIERVRRKDKVLTEYLQKLHGDEWSAVVSATVGGASVLPSSSLVTLPGRTSLDAASASLTDAPASSNSAIARILASAQSSRSLNTASLERTMVGLRPQQQQCNSLGPASADPPASPVKRSFAAGDREAHFSSSPSKMDPDTSFVSAMDVSTFLPPASALPSALGGGKLGGSSGSRPDLGAVQEEDADKSASSAAKGGTAGPDPSTSISTSFSLPDSNAAAAAGGAPGAALSVAQLEIMRASIESTRLLVQGYLRSDAARRTTFEQMVEVAERRTKEFEGVVSVH